jgi:hypothetical protein
MHQIFQLRIVDKTFYSFRITNVSKEYFNSSHYDLINPETCERIKTLDDIMNEVTDYYDYNNLKIEHKRTKVFDNAVMEFRETLRGFREEYINSPNLKKPTEIIIFTDSYSYSATSGFIKGFQNTGGAIVVGYYGNLKINGTDLFDASQSYSRVQNLEKENNITKNLNDLGFLLIYVTIGETFNDSYKVGNQIPKEYAFDPVDERVNIYSVYSDNLLNKFIDEGLKIFQKYNKDGKCNSKNKKLLFHTKMCEKIGKIEYEHGGYKCKENNEWNINECESHYCDIGYYYNYHEKKCIKDYVYNKTSKGLYVYDKDTNKEIDIKKD